MERMRRSGLPSQPLPTRHDRIDRPAFDVHMKVGTVEVASICKAFPIFDLHRPQCPCDKLVAIECLERAVHMYRREAGAVGELFLGHRQLVIALFPQARCLEPEGKFAKKMRDPRARIAATYIRDPFTLDRPINQRVVPHRFADGREPGRDL